MSKKTKFRKLGLIYILALSGIAASLIISQFLIQNYINKQKYDSSLINLAGRQRMLSQKISKLSVQLKYTSDNTEILRFKKELSKAYELFIFTHDGLKNGDKSLGIEKKNSKIINQLFADIETYYLPIKSSTEKIIKSNIHEADSFRNIYSQDIKAIIANESFFLSTMDAIVLQYDKEASEKVDQLSRLELILFFVAITIIILEVIFIFIPLSKNINSTVKELTSSEESANIMAKEINKLYIELGKSYQELEEVNLTTEQPSVFAKIKPSGEISYISQKLKRIFDNDDENFPQNFIEWLKQEDYSENFLNGVIEILKKGNTWTGEIKITDSEGDFRWLDVSMVPVVTIGKSKEVEINMIASDVTLIKEAKEKSREINLQRIEKKVKEQKYRSVLILEGQEEERRRISREIHDGIGQMLIALLLKVQSIVPSSSIHTKNKLDETKQLLKSIIAEIRKVSFNITPSSLSDFGIVPALNKFSTEMSNLSNITIEFENKTRFINRLDKKIETNLYRIIQEAVNNAIKYAKPKSVKIIFEHNSNNLNIAVQDDGKGFDYATYENSDHFGASGHGIFNMRERAAFIDAHFNVETSPGKGTKILLNLPLN